MPFIGLTRIIVRNILRIGLRMRFPCKGDTGDGNGIR